MRVEAQAARLSQSWQQVPPAWRMGLGRVAVAWALLIAAFWPDWAAMAHQWWSSSTYNHILLVPAIVGWLVAQSLPQLWHVAPTLWMPGLAGLGACLLVWVLGAFAGFAQVTQFAVVCMLIAVVPMLLGARAAAAQGFALAYMTYLVPFGDEMVPTLQLITAKLTIGLVHVSAIPARIDGVFIATPAGLFEVAEACSGVKFLVAMIAFGSLAAYVCFVSLWRRAAFMALCVVVPVLANGVRAWGTVYVAQFYGRAVAGGVDHIIYGWFFFAAVIAAIIAMGWRFFDRPAHAPMLDVAALGQMRWLAWAEGLGKNANPQRIMPAAAVMVALALGWVHLAGALQAPLPPTLVLPQVAGWQQVPYAPSAPWSPRAAGADLRQLGRYADAQGHQVDVFVAMYASQGPGKKAGGFGEGALPPESGWSWQAPGPAMAQAHTDRLLTGGPTERLAATTYHTGSLTSGSNLALKLANIGDKLLLRRQPTMLLIISAEEGGVTRAEASIAAFRSSIGPVGPWIDTMGRGAGAPAPQQGQ